jgi:Cu/Ag efflux pump CusA
VSWRPIVPAAAAAACLVGALFVFTLLGKEFLPELDEGDLWVRTQFPVGISIEAVRPYVREIRDRLLKFPEVRVVTMTIRAPQLQIIEDRAATSRYGINVQDVQDVIEAATKGRVVSEIFERERRFNLVVRVA